MSASDDRAIAAAYVAHASQLRGRFLRRTRDEARADDLVQDAFARLVVQSRAGLMPDNVGGWLYRVGMNLLASEARHRAVAQRKAAYLATDDLDPSPEGAAECHELEGRLRSALAAMAPIDRTAIMLAAGGRTGGDIARRLGRSECATRTLLCRARSKLRSTLATA